MNFVTFHAITLQVSDGRSIRVNPLAFYLLILIDCFDICFTFPVVLVIAEILYIDGLPQTRFYNSFF